MDKLNSDSINVSSYLNELKINGISKSTINANVGLTTRSKTEQAKVAAKLIVII